MLTHGAAIRFASKAMVDITGTIMVPAFVAALLGKTLDARLGTGKMLFVSCLVLTFMGTAFILVKKVKMYANEYKNLLR